MYKDHMTLIQELKGYASPKARITRMIKSGEVIQVRFHQGRNANPPA
jgi:hypothetical protein